MATTEPDQQRQAGSSQEEPEGKKEGKTDETEEQPDPYWKLARKGISMLLNNKQKEAEALFKAYPDSLEMSTGYVYAVFTDSLMTFEDDKIKVCLQCMKDLEKKCALYYSNSWLKVVKSKMFGSDSSSLHKELESQIILADTHVFVAMLTFLQQDVSGFIKGGWILRKSYKYYQGAYKNILELYKIIVGDDNVPPASEILTPPSTSPSPISTTAELNQTNQNATDNTSDEEKEEFLDDDQRAVDPAALHLDPFEDTPSSNPLQPVIKKSNYQNDQPADPSKDNSNPAVNLVKNRSYLLKNGYTPLSFKNFQRHPKHSISYHVNLNSATSQGSRENGYVVPRQRDAVASDDQKPIHPIMKKSTSANSGLSNTLQGGSAFSPTSPSFFNISSFGLFSYNDVAKDIDKEAIRRLLCAVSFGFGLLQLGISLLPPTMLKLVNFFGFNGNRKVGLERLMYARTGDDLRAPFATLALLWYHTIVRPFFALDGNNVHAGVEMAADLIEESREEFEESALFLFFRGRVQRLRSEIPQAIETYQAAVANAAQKEVKLMSMHEVGWCYLIELNYPSAEAAFQHLKEQSRWSRPFYSYLCLVSAGSNRMFQEVQSAKDLRGGFKPIVKGTQLDEFLMRRYKICPLDEQALRNLNCLFWKMLVYELLYLWNTLPSCNQQNIDVIIKDCNEAWTLQVEPYLGLSKLVEGSCSCILGKYEEGIRSLREGVEARSALPNYGDDAHVSAFLKYELGLILIKNAETLKEGKLLLESVLSGYKGYDFEQRLSVRVHSILKTI